VHLQRRLHIGQPLPAARRTLAWDPQAWRVIGDEEANQLLRRPYVRRDPPGPGPGLAWGDGPGGQLNSVQDRIRAACTRAGRDPRSVLLLAVSKGQPPENVTGLAGLGQRSSARTGCRRPKPRSSSAQGGCAGHLIGHLQTNKAREAVRLFEMIQSVDSLRLADELNRCADKAARTLPVLLEVNVAGEASKFGYKPEALLAELRQINALPRLEIHGLMTLAPGRRAGEGPARLPPPPRTETPVRRLAGRAAAALSMA